jgi:hypothetical protein
MTSATAQGGSGDIPGVPGTFRGRASRRIDNGQCWVEFLTTGGPRIVGLGLEGGENLLADTPDAGWDSGFGKYELVGGHRLWAAPESDACAYPDMTELVVAAVPGGVRLTGAMEPPMGIRKAIEIRLSQDAASLTLRHFITNEGKQPLHIAPWGISQFKLGGVAFVPLVLPVRAHINVPNQVVALWPYASWSDERFAVGREVLTINATPGPEFKVGCLSHFGVVGYLIDGVLFTKRFDPALDSDHPDLSTNLQMFINDTNIELESLGALATLAPGETVVHDELWEMRAVEGAVEIEALADLLR